MSEKSPVASIEAGLLRGSANLALATVVQRGLGFVANIAAARFAGAPAFGEYQVCLTTVTTLASYLGLGIGTTTLRYGPAHSEGTPEHSQVWHTLWRWAFLSGLASAVAVEIIAEASAGSVLGDALRQRTLQFAIVSAFAVVLYEFLWVRFLVRAQYRSMFVLAAATGTAMIIGLSIAARMGAGAMLITHGAVLLSAVIVLSAKSREWRATAIQTSKSAKHRRLLPEMLRFGTAQVLGTAGLALASWWVLMEVSWHDPTHVAVGNFAVALQLRVLALLVPGLVSQQVMPRLSRETNDSARGRAIWHYAKVLGSLAICSGGLLLAALPFILRLYGDSYASASVAAILFISCAIVQMSNVAPFLYLMISTTRVAAAISLAASAILVIAATFLVPKLGAAGGAAAWLIAEVFSALACLVWVWKRGHAGPSAFGWSFAVYATIVFLASISVGQLSGRSMGFDPGRVIIIVGIACVFAAVLWKNGGREWFRSERGV